MIGKYRIAQDGYKDDMVWIYVSGKIPHEFSIKHDVILVGEEIGWKIHKMDLKAYMESLDKQGYVMEK